MSVGAPPDFVQPGYSLPCSSANSRFIFEREKGYRLKGRNLAEGEDWVFALRSFFAIVDFRNSNAQKIGCFSGKSQSAQEEICEELFYGIKGYFVRLA